ncbi:MAG: GTPase Era [bacterium]
MSYKSGFVAIIGRPNVGKSTLLNQILGQKIAITSSKPQTTRRRIKGFHTSEKGQIIFVDTPGVHKPLYKLGEFLLDEAKLAIPDADLILFMVDGTEVAGLGDRWIVENLLKTEIPIIMLINKVDQVKNMETRDNIVKSYKDLFGEKSVPVIKISAKTGRNVDDLIKNIYRKLPKGPQYYEEDQITDQNLKSIVAETIREKVIRRTKEEVPHSIAVIIDNFEEKENITNISATIFVEHESQKGIIIGDKASMLKGIGTDARIDIEKSLEQKVFLDLFVKLKKNWRKNPSALKQFGYTSK